MAFDGYIMLYPKKIQKYVYLQLDGEKPEILLVAKLLDLFVDPFQSHVCCMYPPSKSSRGKSSKVPFFFGGTIRNIWLVVWNMIFFSIDWEFHHPNWETPSFFTGVGSTTNQTSSNSMIHYKSISQPRLTGGYPSAPGQRSIWAQVRGSPLGMEPIYTSTPTKR